MTTDLSKNLRKLCAERGSIAQICREIGLNRQQFNRYLSGAGAPSAHNLFRIARYFGVPEADLLAPENTSGAPPPKPAQVRAPLGVFATAFADQAARMRRYLGFYHAHFCTPSWEGQVLRSLVRLYEQDGFVASRTFEQAVSVDETIHQKVRYNGLAAYRGNCLYVVESENYNDGGVVETILSPAPRQQVNYLRGMTLGLAWRPRVTPYSSRVIWKRLDERVSAREALKDCGRFPIDSTKLDLTARTFLRSGLAKSPDPHSSVDFF